MKSYINWIFIILDENKHLPSMLMSVLSSFCSHECCFYLHRAWVLGAIKRHCFVEYVLNFLIPLFFLHGWGGCSMEPKTANVLSQYFTYWATFVLLSLSYAFIMGSFPLVIALTLWIGFSIVSPSLFWSSDAFD